MSQGFTKGTPIDTDPTLSLNSDIVVPSQSAVVAYVASQIGTSVTNVTASAPLVSSGGATPNISIPVATSLVNGYLSSTDWVTFNGKADINSPAFTGIPTAPTASSGTNTTQIATTAFVQNAVIQAITLSAIFGDQSTGTTTITGAVTLTEDVYYNDLTISGAGSINTAGYRIFVGGNLDLSNAGALAIYNNGATGNTNATGAANSGVRGAVGITAPGWGSTETTIAISGAGGAGGALSGNGAAGSTPTTIASNTRHTNGGIGGAGGAGGAFTGVSTGGAGGGTQSSSTTPISHVMRTLVLNIRNLDFTRYVINASGALAAVNTSGGRQGGGAGGGGGSTTATGRSGGSGGSGGGIVILYARQITLGSSTNAGAIAANGGTGGAGGTSAFNSAGGGGGGGGGGGYIYLVVGSITGGSYTFMQSNGGTGGNGSTGQGASAIGGTGGTGGNGGRITVINLALNTITQVDGTGNAAATPTTATTIAGTSGTTGGTCTYSS